MSASTLARRSVKSIAFAPGFLRRHDPRDLSILLYHRVGMGDSEIDMPRLVFERQLAWLGGLGTTRSLQEGVARGGVVVTFDDGTSDFHATALPALVRNRVPAVIYVATGQIDAGSDSLTWSQLAEATATGLVEVGAHTHGHVDLSRADEHEAEAELRRSKEMVEDRLGRPCRHFAFPWAVASKEARAVASSLFDTVALDAWRTNRSPRIDPHRLGRTPVLKSDAMFFFRAKARGQLDGEALAYRLLGRGPWRFG